MWRCVFLALASGAEASLKPLLFMDPASDPVEPWGLLQGNPSAISMDRTLSLPPENYSAGATVFAAFGTQDDPGTYEIYVAVGRPGEPLTGSSLGAMAGVSVNRYTTKDFKVYSAPTQVLFLPNGSPLTNDQDIWTVKSMDRNEEGYLLIAYYGSQLSAFHSRDGRSLDSFLRAEQGGSFKDHDDSNLIWSRTSKQWVDMQIIGIPWLTPDGRRTVCPRNLSDNGGCDGGRRVVTYRTSSDGRKFSGDYGCSEPGPLEPFDPEVRFACKQYNQSGLISPHPSEDPPELQFYRIRPFYVGDSGRLAAHALQYAASPAEVNNISSYGYWGPYCPKPGGVINMCHKGHGYGMMHGPHIMEEWWVGSSTQLGPEDLPGWKRPYKRFRAAPHDVWLMSQPVLFRDQHVWVADTGVYTLPLYRLAGVYAPANGEFSTPTFELPHSGVAGLWVNADAKWKGGLVTGGCDEGCAAYIMVEMQDATGKTLPGFERDKCILMDVDGSKLPLKWKGATSLPKPGDMVRLRFYFRDATIYAAGSAEDAGELYVGAQQLI